MIKTNLIKKEIKERPLNQIREIAIQLKRIELKRFDDLHKILQIHIQR